MNMHDYIRKLREKNSLSQWDFGGKLGVSGTFIGMIENPEKKRFPSSDLIKRMGKVFNADTKLMFNMLAQAKVPELKHYTWSARGQYKIAASDNTVREKSAKYGDDIIPIDTSKLRKIPVISWVHAGQWTEQIDNYPPGWADEYIYSDVKGDHVFACKVQNDCMTPEFTEGEYVIVNPDIQVENGNFIVARNEETKETCLRQYKIYGKTKILHCLNPKYDDEAINHKFVMVGKIVKKEKMY